MHVCKCDTVYVSVSLCVNEYRRVRGREEICCGSYKALNSSSLRSFSSRGLLFCPVLVPSLLWPVVTTSYQWTPFNTGL